MFNADLREKYSRGFFQFTTIKRADEYYSSALFFSSNVSYFPTCSFIQEVSTDLGLVIGVPRARLSVR